ncbi:hypothetical protein EYF80_010748 [Liparis tanakae]|uniref:Uncharacterized protein n=1 Tax=Liparis tanakae TaxID=230148 RepID=A0A4Z2IM19_9TELE|nr:hypothetical protein EYF80_010748 [Liparis tanakae]
MFHIKLCRLAKERLKQVGSAGMTVTEKASTVHYIIKKSITHQAVRRGSTTWLARVRPVTPAAWGQTHTVHHEERSDGQIGKKKIEHDN